MTGGMTARLSSRLKKCGCGPCGLRKPAPPTSPSPILEQHGVSVMVVVAVALLALIGGSLLPSSILLVAESAATTVEQEMTNRGIVVGRLQHLDPQRTRTLTFLSAGYTAADRDVFDAHVTKAMTILRTVAASTGGGGSVAVASASAAGYETDPWSRYFYLLNVYSVFEPSSERGASRPNGPSFDCASGVGSSGARADCGPRTVRNNLDCAFGSPQPSRLGCSYEKARALASFAPTTDIIVVLIHDNDYGGTGSDRFAVLSAGSQYTSSSSSSAGGMSNNDFAFLLLHELAHAVGGLGDEYSYGFSSEASGAASSALPNCAPADVAASALPWRDFVSAGLVDATPSSGCSFSNYVRPTADKCYMRAQGPHKGLCPVCTNALARRLVGGGQAHAATATATPAVSLAAPTCPDPLLDVYLGAGDPPVTLSVNHRFLLFNANVSVVWQLPGGARAFDVPSVAIAASQLTDRRTIVTATVTDRNPKVLQAASPASAWTAPVGYLNQTVSFTLYKRFVTDVCNSSFTCTASTGTTYSYCGVCSSAGGEGASASCRKETVVSLYDAKIISTLTEEDATTAVRAAAVALAVVGAVVVLLTVGFVLYSRARFPQAVFDRQRIVDVLWLVAVFFALAVLAAVIATMVYAAQYLPEAAIFGAGVFIGLIVVGVLVYLISLTAFAAALARAPVPAVLAAVGLLLLSIVLFAISAIGVHVVLNRDHTEIIGRFADEWEGLVRDSPHTVCTLQQYFQCSGFYYSCSPVPSAKHCPANCDVTNRNPNACLPQWKDFVWTRLRPGAVAGLVAAFLMLATALLLLVAAVLTQQAVANAAGRRSYRHDPKAPVVVLSARERRQLRREFHKADRDASGALEGDEVLRFVHAAFPGDRVALADADVLTRGGRLTFEDILSAYFPFITSGSSATSRDPQQLQQAGNTGGDGTTAISGGGPRAYFDSSSYDPRILSPAEAEGAADVAALQQLQLAKRQRFEQAAGALSPEALADIYDDHRQRLATARGGGGNKKKRSTVVSKSSTLSLKSPSKGRRRGGGNADNEEDDDDVQLRLMPGANLDSSTRSLGGTQRTVAHAEGRPLSPGSSSLRGSSVGSRRRLGGTVTRGGFGSETEEGSAFSAPNSPNSRARTPTAAHHGSAGRVDASDDSSDDMAGADEAHTAALLSAIAAAARRHAGTEDAAMLRGLSPHEIEGLRGAWVALHPHVRGPLADAEIDRFYQWTHGSPLQSREHFVRWKQLLDVRERGAVGWAEFCLPFAQRGLLQQARTLLREEGREVDEPGLILSREAVVDLFGKAVAASAGLFLPCEAEVPVERAAAVAVDLGLADMGAP